MDVGGNLRGRAFVGDCMAIAIACLRRADCMPLTSKCVARIWKYCRPDRLRGLRFQFVKSAAGDAGSIGHAARARDFRNRTFGLGKNQNWCVMVGARSMD